MVSEPLIDVRRPANLIGAVATGATVFLAAMAGSAAASGVCSNLRAPMQIGQFVVEHFSCVPKSSDKQKQVQNLLESLIVTTPLITEEERRKRSLDQKFWFRITHEEERPFALSPAKATRLMAQYCAHADQMVEKTSRGNFLGQTKKVAHVFRNRCK